MLKKHYFFFVIFERIFFKFIFFTPPKNACSAFTQKLMIITITKDFYFIVATYKFNIKKEFLLKLINHLNMFYFKEEQKTNDSPQYYETTFSFKSLVCNEK